MRWYMGIGGALILSLAVTGARAQPVSVANQPFYPIEYNVLRQAARAYSAEFGPRQQSDYELSEAPDGSAMIDLFDCVADDPMDQPLVDTGANEDHFWLARRVERIRHLLGLFRYPPEAFEQPLLKYEQRMFEFLSIEPPPEPEDWGDPRDNSPLAQAYRSYHERKDEILTQLAMEINERRETLRVQAPPVGVEAGCGAGYFPFIVRTAEPGGRVWLLRAHDFYLCEARGGNPYDLNRCRWVEMDRQRPTMLSGNYMFHATWRDGHVSRGNRVLDEGVAFDAGNNASRPTLVAIPR